MLAIPLPAFSASCQIENCDQQNQFLRPIQDSDRQGERNPRVFLKARKVIPASSQLNPDRDRIFKFSGQPSSHPKFGSANFAQQFRFGAQDYFTPDLNSSQNCFGDKSSILNSPISTSIDHRGVHNISVNSSSLRHIPTNTWTAHLARFWGPEKQFCHHSHLSLDQLRQTTFADFGKLELLEKIFDFLQIPHVTPLGFS